MHRKQTLLGVLFATVVALIAPSAAGTAPTPAIPIPTVTGPIPVTATSHPFNAVAYDKTPRNLDADSYVEQEYLVSGTARVYDWPLDSPVTTIGSGPYTTRILVRRPTGPSKFSGNVVVEMLNPTSLHDLDIVWAAAQQHFIDDGDVWVGVTVKPSSIDDLKVYDPARYGSLSMATPFSPSCSPRTWSGATPTTENGLVWDMVSEVGALLKSDSGDNPLHGFAVRALALTGYSQTAGYVTTYINAFASNATLADGSPVYDAYMPISGANFPTPVSNCAPAPVPGSTRWVIQTPGLAPVISMQTLSDFYKLNGFYSRRLDSTGAAGNYRLYEVAGAGHVWSTQVAYTPSGDELVQAGFPANWWDPYCDGELTTFPLEYPIDGAFANLFRWVRNGVPAPIAARIAVTDPSDPLASPLTDAYGNVIGGLRTPAVEAPVATYLGTTAGTGTCQFLWGSQVPLTQVQIDQLYPRHSDYVHDVSAAADTALAGRWITPADAKRLTVAAKTSQVGAGN